MTGPYQLRNFLAGIPGRTWDRRAKSWRLPLTDESVSYLNKRIPNVPVPQEVLDAITDRKSRAKQAAKIRDGNLDPVGDMPVKGAPYRHQSTAHDIGMVLLTGGV